MIGVSGASAGTGATTAIVESGSDHSVTATKPDQIGGSNFSPVSNRVQEATEILEKRL